MNLQFPRSVALLAAILLAIPWTSVHAQNEKPEQWRYLTVTVTDQKGRLIGGLTSGDFEVYEAGKRCQITSFSTADEPVTMGFLIDTSGSMQKTWLRSEAVVREIIADFMAASHPENEYFVVSLNDRTRLLQDSTRDHQRVLETIATGASGRTALYDAVYLALSKANQRLGKKVLILFSDGGDNQSEYSFNELKQTIGESDVMIHAFYVADQDPTRGPIDPVRRLENMAALTGGIVFFHSTGTELVIAVRRLAVELRHQCRIGYIPARPINKREWRKVAVKVHEKPGLGKLKVRARQRYIVTP